MKVRKVGEGDADNITNMITDHLWLDPNKEICIVDAETEITLITEDSGDWDDDMSEEDDWKW